MTVEDKIADAIKKLGLSDNYTKEKVEKAFRHKSMTCHPDKFPEKEETFKALGNAKAFLLAQLEKPKSNDNARTQAQDDERYSTSPDEQERHYDYTSFSFDEVKFDEAKLEACKTKLPDFVTSQ